MKWLAVAAALIAAALIVLWYEARSSGPPAAATAPAPVAKAAPAPRAYLGAPIEETPGRIMDDRPLPPHVRPAGVMAPEDDAEPIRKYSDEFWERVDETYSRRLLGFAADCYQGGKERKQKLKLAFRFDIAGGKVSVKDVRMVESTLNDPALEACMTRAVAGATFEDKNMPDWASRPDEEETLLVRIETLKRFMPQSDD